MSHADISKIKKGFNLKSSTSYFGMMTKILSDFQICISAPLITFLLTNYNIVWSNRTFTFSQIHFHTSFTVAISRV